MPSVARLNVAPVKSTRLRHPEELVLGTDGAPHDRRFLFLDDAGKRLSGTAKVPLLTVVADYDAASERLALRLPNGTHVRGPARATGSPFRVQLFDHDVEVREIPGPVADAVSRYLGRPVRLARVAPGSRAGGAAPVSLLSLSAVHELARRAGEPFPDPGRFRMLVEIEGAEPHEEDTWEGRRIRIGEALIRVKDPCVRCVITNHSPATGEEDFPTLATLGTYRRHDDGLRFGRYASVVEPGRVRVGDAIGPED